MAILPEESTALSKWMPEREKESMRCAIRDFEYRIGWCLEEWIATDYVCPRTSLDMVFMEKIGYMSHGDRRHVRLGCRNWLARLVYTWRQDVSLMPFGLCLCLVSIAWSMCFYWEISHVMSCCLALKYYLWWCWWHTTWTSTYMISCNSCLRQFYGINFME